MSDVRARLIRAFQVVFPDAPADTIPAMSVQTTPVWDSIHSINLLQVIEEEFGVQIDFEDLEHLNSFDAIFRRLSP
jgi:acyl carrier protein